MRAPDGITEMSDLGEPWDQRLTKVEAVLRRFATSEPPSTNAIPYAALIPAISRELVWAARRAPPTVDRKKAKAKLIKMRKTATAVEADLLSDPALAVMIPLEDRLSIGRIANLEVKLNGKLGAPRNNAAERVATFLAQHFEGLTGSPPARNTLVRNGDALRTGGAFIDLLAEIYGVLKIEASADSQAKSAISAMEKSSSEI
jgi:hypothetical protein